MSNEALNHPDDLARDELLVAYLDGELDAESSRDVEQRLANQVAVRERLHELERAWDVLEVLPTPEINPRFTGTTLEMVAQVAEQEQQGKTSRFFTPRTRRLLVGVAALLVAFGAGLLVSANRGRSANDQLVNDLPILEELDAYRRADNIQFLRMIRDAKLFPTEASDER